MRQAVVVIHGMGEQRPVETLNSFSRAITPEGARFYSRSDKVTVAFDSRRHLIPTQTIDDTELDTQTEIYEYHWAYMMKGNRLDDLWPTFRRILFPAPGIFDTLWALFWIALGLFGWATLADAITIDAQPWLKWIMMALGLGVGFGSLLRWVPSGLVVLWVLIWAGILWTAWAFYDGPFSGIGLGADISEFAAALIGGGLAAGLISYLVSRVLPSWLTTSFVDVVRYLDTSPRSYEIRTRIRRGIVDLLTGLHDSGRYDRVMIVAHSLGSYIGYDAISHLWSQMGKLHMGPNPDEADGGATGGSQPDGLLEVERAASRLEEGSGTVEGYQRAQRQLWGGLRKQGSPWLITDFISFGSPMYFADRLYTRSYGEFRERIARLEIDTCPPENEKASYNNVNGQRRFFSWNNGGRRVPHEGAAFLSVRWTNIWYPSFMSFFGDWFGGPLAPLYGKGIRDVPISKSTPKQYVPGYAHSVYLTTHDDRGPGTFVRQLTDALELNAKEWLSSLQPVPPTDPDTR